MRFFFITFFAALIFTGLAFAQTPQPPKADKPDTAKLKLTETEAQSLQSLQSALITAGQEFDAAQNALKTAVTSEAVSAAAWRWKATQTAFETALAKRADWLKATAAAHDCAECDLDLQKGEFVRKVAK